MRAPSGIGGVLRALWAPSTVNTPCEMTQALASIERLTDAVAEKQARVAVRASSPTLGDALDDMVRRR